MAKDLINVEPINLPDVNLNSIGDIITITFNSDNAKAIILNDNKDIAEHIYDKCKLDIMNSFENIKNIVSYLISHNLSFDTDFPIIIK